MRAFMQRRQAFWSWLVIAALFATQIILRFHSSLNHDSSWFLVMARRLLAGKHLYSDILEVNPPIGIWLTVPSVWLAAKLGLSGVTVYYAFFFILTAACIGLVNRYLKFLPGLLPARRHAYLVIFSGGLLFLPAANFCEREHLAIVLFLPWLFLRMARRSGATISWPETAAVGAIAAVAIAIKPQAVVAPVLVEVFFLWRSRKISALFAIENIAAVLTAALAFAAIWAFAPEFLTTMVPLGKTAYLPFIGYPALVQIYNARWCIILLVVVFAFASKLNAALREHVLTLGVAAFGFGISYAIQNKGFSYQILPATVCAWSALGMSLTGCWPGPQDKRLFVPLAAGLAVLTLSTEPQTYVPNDAVLRQALMNYAPEAKSAFIASTKLSHGFPFVEEQGLEWSSRLPTQWLAPYVAAKWHGGPLPEDGIVQLALDATVTDMIGGQPDIIFVDQDPDQVYVPGGKFDYIGFWSNDPRFARFWQGYEQRSKQDTFAVFTKK